MREQFDFDLQEMKAKLLELSHLSEAALTLAMEGLRTCNMDIALQVIENDARMDQLEEEINEFALMLITKQQPIATDLRRVFAAIKMATDVERIADHAVNIAKATIRLGEKDRVVELTYLEQMFVEALAMLKLAVQAYIEEDVQVAKQIAKMDDRVDELYGVAIRTYIATITNKPEDIHQITQLSFVARYIERVADHVTNMAEHIFYLVKGKHYVLNE